MNADLPHPMLAAPFGAPVRGMQVSDSGITPGLIVVDSSRPAALAANPALAAGAVIAQTARVFAAP